MFEPAAPAMGEATANIGRAYESMGSRQARRSRQEPPCFEGIETVSCLRPFFRRRDRTARPQRVAIRARKPCLLIRRRFRGLYDGFMRPLYPPVSPRSYLRTSPQVKVDFSTTVP